MFVFGVVLFSTLQVFVVKCGLTIVEPTIAQHAKSVKSVINMLGSMTPYHVPTEPSPMLKSCTATKAMLLMRHGPKYPKQSVMDDFKKLENIQKILKNTYSNDKALDVLPPNSKIAIGKIMKWENKMSNAIAKSTNEEGNMSLEELGKRWNAKLNNLGQKIKKTDIQYYSAPEKRCKDSGLKFLQGFLKGNVNNIDATKITIENNKPEDHRIELNKVDKDAVKVKTSGNKLEDVEDVYLKIMCPGTSCYLVDKIQKLLFPDNTVHYVAQRKTIDTDLIKTMYLACANSYGFKTAVEGHAWCNVFDYYDLEMFEGLHDIQYYYKNGYHHKGMANVGHPMMEDILDFLSNSGSKKFKLFSAHTANCLSMITGFRLYRDNVKLTIYNMTTGEKMKDRKWRTSFIANFMCNITVAVFECNDNNLNSKRVSIYLNEIPLKMISDTGESCTQCPIADVENLIRKLLNDEIPDASGVWREIRILDK